VIFLTSREDGHDRAMALGAVGYVNKPVERDTLVALVRQHLPQPA